MDARPFLFGKLPAHGDFVVRGLGSDRATAWDDWASGALSLAREQLGDAFESAHEASAPWRFVAGPSRLGADWRAGALAASVDAAGRRFLVVIGQDGLDEASAAQMGDDLARDAEAAIYEALTGGLDADAALAIFEGERSKPGEAPPAARAGSIWWSCGDDVFSGEPPLDLLVRSALPLAESVA